MVRRKSDTVLTPMAVIIINTNQMKTRKNKIFVSPGGARGKEPGCHCRRHKRCGFDPWVRGISWSRASILAWRIPCTEEPGRLQSVGLQRVWHDWSDLACMHETHIGTWFVVWGRYYYQIHFTNEATEAQRCWSPAQRHAQVEQEVDGGTCSPGNP